MTLGPEPAPRGTGVVEERPGPERRDPTALHRDAVAIWRLLVELDEADHRVRSRLLAARAQVRAEAATQWRQRGWRSIADDV